MTVRQDFNYYKKQNNWPACAAICAQAYEILGTFNGVAKEFGISRATAARYVQISRCFKDLKTQYGPYKLSIRHGMALAMLASNKRQYEVLKGHMYAKALKGQKVAKIQTSVLIRKYTNGQIDFKVYVGNLTEKEGRRLLERLIETSVKIDEMANILTDALCD